MSRSVGSRVSCLKGIALLALFLLPNFFQVNPLKAGGFLPEDSIRIQGMLDTLIANRRSDSDWAMMMADSIIRASKRANFHRGILNGYNQKGNAYWDKGDFIASRKYYLAALPWSDSINSPKGKAIVLNNVGSAERMLGNYSEALGYHLEAREIFEKIGEMKGMATAINNAAIIYKVLNDDSTAIREYKISAALSYQEGKLAGYASSLINISILFQESKETDSARFYLDLIFGIDPDKLPPIRLCQAQSSLASNYFITGDYDSALACIKSCQRIAENISDDYLKLTLKTKEGNIRRRLGQRAQARKLLEEVRNTAQIMKAPEIEKSVLHILISMDEEGGDYKGALEKYRDQIEIRDSMLGAEQQQRIAALRNQYEGEKRDRELAELNLELAAESEALRNREIDLEQSLFRIGLLIALAVLLLVVVGFIAYRLWENARRTRMLKEKQELTERALREKEVLVGEVHHRVKNNLQVIYNILDLQSRTLEAGAGREALQESMTRISAMALVHNELYRQDDLSGVRMEEYLPRLAKLVQRGFTGNTGSVDVEVQVTPGLVLDLDSAIPIGMLINELVTNSLKHAFKGGVDGKIGVRLEKVETELELVVWDNGRGKSEDGGAGSFGTRLIQSLVRQMKGTMQESVDAGTKTLVTLRKFKELEV